MKKDIMRAFNLQGVILDKMEAGEKEILLYVRSPRTEAECPLCGRKNNQAHQIKSRKVKHDIVNGKNIVLVIKKRRFKCKKCACPFSEPNIPGVTRKRSTEHFQVSAIKELVNSNFKTVGERYHVSSPTLLKYLAERKRDIPWPDGDIILNVDEHSYAGRDLKITIGDSVSGKLLAVLKNDNQSTLRYFLKNAPEGVKSRISEACIDMKQSYRVVLGEELPHAKVVVDRFHVVRELGRQLDEIRKIIQESGRKGEKRIPRLLLLKNSDKLADWEKARLEYIFKSYKAFQALEHCYWVKEKMREMYQCNDYKEAKRKLDLIINDLRDQNIGKMREVRDMLIRWKPYILNFFYSRTTNGFIEGVHNKIKTVKRMSYGFRNFRNYVLKVTLALLPFVFLPQIWHTNV